jgi:SAM-dependent methyltransferase
LSDSWHKHINCPRCGSYLRQRLFFAVLQNIEELSFDRVISGKRILHFAPEDIVSLNIRDKAAQYTTADFLRDDCDCKLDMSNMPEIKSDSFDVVIAFDVLEHVPDYQKALEEVHRILSSRGFGIFTVPQKDNLEVTYEDPTLVTPQDRTKHYGQWDHLRIFGEDFQKTVENKDFTVFAVNESMFSEDVNKRHVLFPPLLSKHPLATNFRRVFFCEKTS